MLKYPTLTFSKLDFIAAFEKAFLFLIIITLYLKGRTEKAESRIKIF